MSHILITSILVLTSIQFASAVDLACSDPSKILVNGTDSFRHLSWWCCPSSNPVFAGYENYYGNPNQYADPYGNVYPYLPSCGGCVDSQYYTLLCSDSSLSPPILYCCLYYSKCSWGYQLCEYLYSTARGNEGNLVVATPAIDLDLCRFKKSSNGSIVPGSPCEPQITCEMSSQTQFQCMRCTDPRVGPPGICNTFICPDGLYCPGSLSVDATNLTASLMIQNITCPFGHYCPAGSATPITCTGGQQCYATGLATAKPCQPGAFCDGEPSIQYCIPGQYCPRGSSQPTTCPPGTYCPNNGMSEPFNCTAGAFCDGLHSTTCAPSYICPYDNMGAPILCTPPQHCPSSGMTYAQDCSAGNYCPDVLTVILCPAGSYCPGRVAAAIPCDSGSFAAELGATVCISCNSVWFTSNSGATGCHKVTPLLIGMICLAIIVFILFAIGSVFCVRYWVKFHKEAEAEDVRKAIEAELARRMAEMRHQQAVAPAERQQIHRQQAAEFEAHRNRVKSELMERLMRDLHTDLKLHHPGFEDNEANPSQLQKYEQFLAQFITSQFDNEACELFAAVNMLVANPNTYSTLDFHNSLIGIRSFVIEFFPVYQISVAAMVQPEAGNDAVSSPQLQPIRVRLMRELARHARAWLIKIGTAAAGDGNSNNGAVVPLPAMPPQSLPHQAQPSAPPLFPINHHAQVAPDQVANQVYQVAAVSAPPPPPPPPSAPAQRLPASHPDAHAALIISPSQISPPEAVLDLVDDSEMPLPGVPIES